jgi:hypothetical protein
VTSLSGCKSTSINDEIGRRIKIDVYVNDVKVDTPVHRNNREPEAKGGYTLADFVLLRPICEAIGATFDVRVDYIEIRYKGNIYVVEKGFLDQSSYMVIGDDVYIQFRLINGAMNGSLEIDGKKAMYLYTSEYIRLDIPATLEECYKALDKKLDRSQKNTIKKSSGRAFTLRSFWIRMWIHTNWITPQNSRIEKAFRDAGYTSTDEMCYEIILGYHYYLNGIPYELIPKKDKIGGPYS